MKKVMIVVAAMAMIAFSGCKKDSDTFMLRVTGVNAESSDKEGWYNVGNQVVFQQGDQVFVNGLQKRLELEADAIDAAGNYSRFAMVEMCPDQLNYPATLLYPASAYSYDDVTDAMSTTVPVRLTMPAAGTAYAVSLRQGDFVSQWPLVAYLDEVTRGSVFSLKNTTALIAPAIKFGANFISSFNQQYSTNYTSAATLTVTEVRFLSDNYIAGPGFVENIETANNDNPACVFHVDPTWEPSNIIYAYPAEDTPAITVTNGDRIDIVGNFPVAELPNGANVKMVIYFTINEGGNSQEMTYVSDNLTVGQNGLSIRRNERTTMTAPFFSTRTDFHNFYFGHEDILPSNLPL
ncbi:MAG: hypothetical protein MJZ45_04870 [Bacteroidales bacterium]|nr:hypothetical protein [Bacteroidales bacterium]